MIEKSINFLVDVWSIGCIFVEIITHEVLFRSEHNLDHWTRITKIVGSPDEEFDQRISQAMSDLTDQVVLEIITFVRQQPIRKPIPWEIIVKDSCFLPSECTQLNGKYLKMEIFG